MFSGAQPALLITVTFTCWALAFLASDCSVLDLSYAEVALEGPGFLPYFQRALTTSRSGKATLFVPLLFLENMRA